MKSECVIVPLSGMCKHGMWTCTRTADLAFVRCVRDISIRFVCYLSVPFLCGGCTVTRQRDITVAAPRQRCNGTLTGDQRRFHRVEARSLRLESDRTVRQAPPHTQCYHSQRPGATISLAAMPTSRMNSRQSFSPSLTRMPMHSPMRRKHI
jgi:hypothetical protein